MKKIFSLIPLIIIPLLCSCDSESKTQLTYGTLIEHEAVQISSSDFDTLVHNNENFLLAIYPENGDSCWCWRHFSSVINEAVNTYQLSIYKFYAHLVEDNKTMQEMGGFKALKNAPTFYIINNKSIAKSYEYNDMNPFFSDIKSFMGEIDKRCYFPKIIKVDEITLQEKINSESSLIYFARGTCNDCNYVTPNFLVPYYTRNQDSRVMYYFDLDVFKQSSDPDLYQNKKDEYLLSNANNPELGFNTGYVPTFQYYESGLLKDMDVYFNDGQLSYDEVDNCYYATNTYFSGERLNYFHYIDNVKIKDLSKVKIAEEDTNSFGEYHYWKNEKSAIYHSALLESFLNIYNK